MAHVRPYNSNVRVGNWFEDVALEEVNLAQYCFTNVEFLFVGQTEGIFGEKGTWTTVFTESW